MQIELHSEVFMKRSSGVLMPIFCLASNYGIGTLGKEAYDFIDFLVDTKQTYWQTLPIMATLLILLLQALPATHFL